MHLLALLLLGTATALPIPELDTPWPTTPHEPHRRLIPWRPDAVVKKAVEQRKFRAQLRRHFKHDDAAAMAAGVNDDVLIPLRQAFGPDSVSESDFEDASRFRASFLDGYYREDDGLGDGRGV